MPKNKKATKKKSVNKPITRSSSSNKSLDSIYILKLTVYLILGSQWVHFVNQAGKPTISLPLGAIAAILLATHDRLKIDRKIEYAVILVSMFIGYFLPAGLTVVI